MGKQPGQQIVGGKRVENMTEKRMMKRQIGRIKGEETMQGLERGINRHETDQPLQKHDSGGNSFGIVVLLR